MIAAIYLLLAVVGVAYVADGYRLARQRMADEEEATKVETRRLAPETKPVADRYVPPEPIRYPFY